MFLNDIFKEMYHFAGVIQAMTDYGKDIIIIPSS